MGKQIRNYGPIPFLDREGHFIDEIPIDKWIQPAKITRVPTLKNKITRQDNEVPDSNKTQTKGTKAIDIPPTMQPNKNQHRENGKHDKQKGKINSKVDSQADLKKNPNWAKNLLVWQRLFAHHTLNSIRKSVVYVCNNAPRDKLDFVLDSTYRHEDAVFPEVTDVYLQSETLGRETWRVLRNNKHIPPPAVISRGHPIKFGGITQRSNTYNVNLSIPSPHAAQTNAGYSRREDGVFYKV
ncbi:hypothetical protein L798_11924 [Zootermopsis nevadensis]|uniref:Uncharacterized protein n=2 Tax=Zootermopsis nevadensis TaxID=136037 RepID=A0A067R6Q6_ZOONE|nr:hypothetical protein L798_11924 [Zootermopsis nevadensis]